MDFEMIAATGMANIAEGGVHGFWVLGLRPCPGMTAKR
jgi:hypothetical protein